MGKRKHTDGDLLDGESSVPIPIQTFLWRQTSPFIRSKLGKLCDASCLSFERVLAQNILHGLSPSLCEAIQSVPRWRLIQAAFPHVMHCCAAALRDRKNGHPDEKFTANEVKLLYTLHWSILDAASECEDIENDQGIGRSLYSYLHSLDTIQLFIYLFAPLLDSIKESDFQSLKLENGIRLWQPLWDHRQPDVPCFSTPVKAKRVVLKAHRNLMKVNFNLANIYIGKGTSNDNVYLGTDDDLCPSPGGSYEAASPRAPLARLSDICALSTTATETSVEIVCEICNETLAPRSGELSCSCGVRRSSYCSVPDRKSIGLPHISSVDKDYMARRLENATFQTSPNPDILSASYLDVAVMRCLFCPQWSEEGLFWGLRYINQRLIEICEELNHREYHRQRSYSLPTPHLTDHGDTVPSTPASPKKHTDFHNPLKLFNKDALDGHKDHHRREPPFKKMKDKVLQLTRRDSMEHIDVDHRQDAAQKAAEMLVPNGADLPSRPSSALSRLPEGPDDSPDDSNDSYESSTDIIRRKSMPALRRHKNKNVEDEEDEDSSGSGRGGKEAVTRTRSLVRPEILTKPIITITKESPDQSLANSLWFHSKRESLASEKSEDNSKSVPMQRSNTDSNIRYNSSDEMEEVAGSLHYIQGNGQLNYSVVLLAVHGAAGRECSPRVSGVLLNIINCLLDLKVIEKTPPKPKAPPKSSTPSSEPASGDKENFCLKKEDFGIPKKTILKKDKTAHNFAMESMIRIYKMIGCPNGCGDGYRGNLADSLRIQASFCLTRLMNINMGQFRKFIKDKLMKQPLQSVMDFLHALLGFCVDPGCATSPLGSKKSSTKEGGQTGYANNFGEPFDGGKTVQGQIVAQIAQPLVSKFVENKKELSSHDSGNIGLYCDVRQFVNYMKEMNGGTFRKVALSCLLEKCKIEPVYAKETTSVHGVPKSTKAIRRNMSITSETGEERAFRESIAAAVLASVGSDDGRRPRSSIFKRRTKKTPILPPPHGAMSDSEMLDDLSSTRSGRLSPRVSMSATEDDPASGPSTPKRKFSKFNIAWRRAAKSDPEDDSASESPAPSHRKESKTIETSLVQHVQGHLQNQNQAPPTTGQGAPASKPKKMSFKAASQATLSFLTARKRIEDGLKSWSKRRTSKRDSIDDDFSRRGSHEVGNNQTAEKVVIRKRKLVQAYAMKSGLLRFNFMLDCTQPGSLPDPHLIAALLDLEAPVIGRAALLLECAHFVNRCNRGDWPNWMKLNLPGFRQVGLLPSRGQPSGYRRNVLLQRTAGAMFHQWGEAIANRLYTIMTEEAEDKFNILHQVKDDGKKKELRAEDEEENFMDEATVNASGSECPYALRMVACQLLLEITTFLRETYQYLPRSKLSKQEGVWDKPPTSRRWSSVLSSPGHSERSNSRSSQGDTGGATTAHLTAPDQPPPPQQHKVSIVLLKNPDSPHSTASVYLASDMERSPSDRTIKFANFGVERSDSIGSSTTTISQMDLSGDGKGRTGGTGGGGGGGNRTPVTQNKKSAGLLKTRRGSGHNSSFRNRSVKIKRPEGGGSIKRLGSVKAPRKVSTQSLQSTVSFDDGEPQVIEHIDEVESLGMLSDEAQDTSPDLLEIPDDHDHSKVMPWIKVVVQLANTSNFICDHQNYCHPNCYERQRRSCIRLMTAVRKIYDSEPPTEDAEKTKKEEKKDTLKDKLKRRESMFQPSSPTRRRESTPLLEKIKTDANLSLKLKMVMAQEKKSEKTKKQKPKDLLPIQKYFKIQAQNLTHAPLSVITKSAPILSDDSFLDMMPVAWELLLESDQELAAAAAAVFLLASVKAPSSVQDMMTRQLQHEDVNQRIHAVLRYGVLWRSRHQVWPRMEDGANGYFKVPPPSIDFVLPSPTIGLPSLQIVDPPWQPHFKTKVAEVTINSEESKSFVTATTTRRKEQQEMLHRALLAEEDRRRAARENFHMTAVPIMQQAAYEPALHHVTEDHEEAALSEEISLAQRRMSVAPVNRQANMQNRNLATGRHGSMFWIGRPTIFEGEEERPDHPHTHHLQQAQHFFPSCVCQATLPIIHLLEDLEVNQDGIAVYEVAKKIIWMCLVEEPTLFLRTFLEKLTTRSKQEELIFLLRKLLFHMPELPAQTAHCLFNYLVGFIMFYVRSPAEGGQEAIGEALSVLFQVVPSVHGIYFKDLKQTLRKEQCDPTLMVTANVPSAKKLIVHGPDLSSIPSQWPIHEDTQFFQILQDSLDFFNIPEEQHNSHFLIDTKTNQMHNLNSYVRDFYFFRRNHYPQLSLVHMNCEEASKGLQKQAFSQKFAELGKVLFTLAILEGSQGQQQQNHVAFLHEELLKLPSFPRKALETDFCMQDNEMGKEVSGVNMLHKYAWTKLMLKLFRGMSSTITCSGDLPLFLNVINGTLYLHAEDTAMLKITMATYINAARHFKQVFSTNGFLYIMPSILRVYSNHQSNTLVCELIEFTCRQFFLLHRNPFMLQLFGTVAPILNMYEHLSIRDCSQVDPQALFNLLLALEKHIPDRLDIMELVEGDKPLRALDFCYIDDPDTFTIIEAVNMCVTVVAYTPLITMITVCLQDFCYIDDPDTFTIIDAVNMCVTVVAYASDSTRAIQMLTILEAILPFYLRHLKEKTDKKDRFTFNLVREELSIITNLGVSVRALVCSCEAMTRNFSGPQRQLESVNTASMKASQNHSNHSPQGPTIYCDEHSDIRFNHMEEGLARGRRHFTSADDDAEATLKEFRKPRNSLLCVVADFYRHCGGRVKDLRRMLSDPAIRAPELLDHKAHTRLADIANTLLKIAPYDPATMKMSGLQKYMVDILPITDWGQEAVRPALNLVLRRLERLFSKIYKKPVLRRYLDWEAAANLLKGVHSTLAKFSFIAHLPHLKTLINVCLNVLLADEGGLSTGDSIPSVQHGRPSDAIQARMAPPAMFCSAVIKLTAMQMQALGDQYSLEHLCGGMSVFPTVEKSINILVSLVLPLVTRMGSGRRDCPKMRPVDMTFALSTLLHALAPPTKQPAPATSATVTKPHTLSVGEVGRTGSVTSGPHHHRRHSPRETLQNVAFLGLKILLVCCEEQLCTEWSRIVHCVEEIGAKLLGGIPLWRFIDFVVTNKSPLFMMFLPFIEFKMMKAACHTEQEFYIQRSVYRKLQGQSLPTPRSKGTVLVELAAELKHIKEDFCVQPACRQRSSTTVSDYSARRPSVTPAPYMSRASSIHDLIEEQLAARLHPVLPSVPLGGKHIKGSSSTNPLRRQLSQHSSTEHTPSPAIHRKCSQRISAKEGSLILDKYKYRPLSTDDDADPVHSPTKRFVTSSNHPKLRRQVSIYQKKHITKQRSVFVACETETIYESEDEESTRQKRTVSPQPHNPLRRSSTLVTHATQPFQRRDGIIRRARFSKHQALSFDSSFVPYCEDICNSFSSPANASREQLVPMETLTSQDADEPPDLEEDKLCASFLNQRSGGGGLCAPTDDPDGQTAGLTAETARLTDPDLDPRSHRLQRQDAKSRKTFKIKRNQRSTVKGSIMRSATVKGNPRSSESPHGPGSPVSLTKMSLPTGDEVDIASFGNGAGFGHLERIDTMPDSGEDATDTHVQDPGADTGLSDTKCSSPGPTEVIRPPDSKPPRSSRQRFIQKSRSHEESCDAYVSVGTARARIARHAPRLQRSRSRSPSASPSRQLSASPSSAASPSRQMSAPQTYLTRSESVDSVEENAALLGRDDVQRSHSSLLYTEPSDTHDQTCV